MKTVFNVILGLCALVLIYICYTSIMGPINFEKAKKHRDAAVIARLIDIRKAQLEYRTLHDQQYTANYFNDLSNPLLKHSNRGFWLARHRILRRNNVLLKNNQWLLLPRNPRRQHPFGCG